MIKFISLSLSLSLSMFACGSESTTNYTYLNEQTGGSPQEYSSTQFSTGGSSNSTTTNETGGNYSTGSTSTTQTSTGGNSSVITSASTGGNSPTQTSAPNTCVKKTCDQIIQAQSTNLSKASACGMAPDGCGGLLNCGPCTTDGTPNTDCGQAPKNACPAHYNQIECSADTANGCVWSPDTSSCYGGEDWSGGGLVAVANVCGTRCIKAKETRGVCDNGTPMWICPSSIPPIGMNGCSHIANNNWCCDKQ